MPLPVNFNLFNANVDHIPVALVNTYVNITYLSLLTISLVNNEQEQTALKTMEQTIGNLG